ncbi:transcription termination/antitermination NusG family protein [Pararhodobacter zhoushanensis]|uniref:NusG-like N-terminal domain-containing protein n=1 Tax=Pararhodobacter zhoushanensis TaxID=2479545 RepID=A0ABT3GYL3_9RHOB|nr:transcription termination/antitermination NusG family protein [Pararhodobacter zhoushanensis]MCW1932626.1 hypothetical protein [Pararhodobacter zhoushanensis]
MARAFDGRGAVAVGDVVSTSGPAPLFQPGPAQWYALRVAAQRESFVERWLSLRGVMGFHPVLTRTVVRHGRKLQQAKRYLPGYVFARFPGYPVVHAIRTLPHVLGALTVQDGNWACIKPEDLRALYDMRQVDAKIEDAEAAAAARRKAARALRAGGGALFRAGPMAGTRCEVIEIAGSGDVRVRLRLFGAEHLVSTRAEDLISIRKAS